MPVIYELRSPSLMLAERVCDPRAMKHMHPKAPVVVGRMNFGFTCRRYCISANYGGRHRSHNSGLHTKH